MQVIVLASQKGGVGKTTLAVHLAVEAQVRSGGPVAMIDTDPQGSMTAWWNERKADTPALSPTPAAELPAKIKALENAGFRMVFIDTPPAITASVSSILQVSDFVLIPVRPSPNDLRAVGRTIDLVRANAKPFAFVLTQAKQNARLTLQALAALSEHGVVAGSIIGDRVDYAASMITGQTTSEIDGKGRAAAEVSGLLDFVLRRMAGGQTARQPDSQEAR